jgi:hypothetical protein
MTAPTSVTSYFAFHQQTGNSAAEELAYEQSRHEWLGEIFGCENEEAAVQEVGIVDTREGRPLTWPNILQYKVQPFDLADPTKPSHRRILALFLVDPTSALYRWFIPCERKDWWGEAIQQVGALSRFPAELQDQLFA